MPDSLSDIMPNIKEERCASPFPTIPDVSQNPEIPQIPKTKSEITENTVEEPLSPFPRIPNVNTESNIISKDIEQIQKNEAVESSFRSGSPFPLIPDVTLNPEVVEKDITQIRLSPSNFTQANSEINIENELLNHDKTIDVNSDLGNNLQNLSAGTEIQTELENQLPHSTTEASFAFPDIPVVTDSIQSNKFLFQVPLRKYEPVSLTGKKYKLKEPTFETSVKKPEYNFALADTTSKVVERMYSEGTTNNIRSLQSEVFESQGHFNASRSCSPYPVYIPTVSKESIPPPKDPQIADNNNSIPAVLDTEREDVIQIPHTESHIEKQLRESTITGNKTVSENVKSQQKCFSELRDIQFCYAIANGETIQIDQKCNDNSKKNKPEENEIQKRLKEMKNVREGKSLDTFHENEIESSASTSTNNVKTTTITKPNEIRVVEFSSDRRESTALKQECSNIHSQAAAKVEEKLKTDSEDPDVPGLMCKKPPDAIIGARPLFGQLDITSEFKKAIVGRSKSLQSKRSRTENKQIEKSLDKSEVKAEKLENIETEDITEDSKLLTQMKDMTKAEIIKLQENKNEEIEKIYFQQEREYEVDIQTTKNDFDLSSVLQNIGKPEKIEYFQPHSYAVANTRDVTTKDIHYGKTNSISKSSRVNSDLNFCSETTLTSQQQESNDEEEYRKVPVKSLIQNFEQCSMPAMRYKQIREPLPDVVDKLSNSKAQSKNIRHDTMEKKQNQILYTPESQILKTTHLQDSNLRKAEEEFDHLFYIANTSVKTQPYFPKLEMQNFQQSENSSFCRYSSQTNLSQHVPCNPLQGANSYAAPKLTEEVVQKGKLCFIH